MLVDDTEDTDTIQLIFLVGGVLSLCGSLFMTASSWTIVKRSKTPRNRFSKQLIFQLSLNDVFLSILFITMGSDISSSPVGCQFQGALMELLALSAILWNGSIATHLFSSIVLEKGRRGSYKVLLIIYSLISWGIPSLFTIILLAQGEIGGSGAAFCWIASSSNALFYEMFFFFGFLVVALVWNIFVFFAVRRKIRQVSLRSAAYASNQLDISKIDKKLYFFQAAFVLVSDAHFQFSSSIAPLSPLTPSLFLSRLKHQSWVCPVIFRLRAVSTSSSQPLLAVLQAVLMSCTGLFNAIIYYDQKLGLKFWRPNSASRLKHGQEMGSYQLESSSNQLTQPLVDQQ